MEQDREDLEELWESLLSRDSERILDTWERLTLQEQISVYSHVKRMVSEEGWQEPQRVSAEAALAALPIPGDPGDEPAP